VSEGIESALAVVIPDAGASYSSVGHRFNEQENIGLIYGTPAERKRS
jgi:hypothetical protein